MISETLMYEISLLQTSDCRRVISEKENQFPQHLTQQRNPRSKHQSR